MSDDEEITPTPPEPDDESEAGEVDPAATDRRVRELTTIVQRLAAEVDSLTGRVTELAGDENSRSRATPAPWVWFSPPAGAEDPAHRDDGHTPRWTVENFVAWYNTVYIGAPGSPQVRAIPACWQQHPGLSMEISTLAYEWRRANLGRSADPRDAQSWHHSWRPGFVLRLSDWVHPRCLDGDHQPHGAPPRASRYPDVNDQHLEEE